MVQFFVDLCQFARVEGPSTDVAVLRACFDLDLFEIGADAQCMPNGILPIASRGAIEVGEMCANKLVDLRHGQLSILAVAQGQGDETRIGIRRFRIVFDTRQISLLSIWHVI